MGTLTKDKTFGELEQEERFRGDVHDDDGDDGFAELEDDFSEE